MVLTDFVDLKKKKKKKRRRENYSGSKLFSSLPPFLSLSHLAHGEKDEPDENTTNTIKGEASITIVSIFVFEIDSK
jgi:hypothetical protein